MKEKITQKTYKIEEIKDTLKRSQLLHSRKLTKNADGIIQGDEDVVEEVAKKFENDDGEEDNPDISQLGGVEEEENEEELVEDEQEEEDEEDNNDNGMEELDPQILKL